MPQSEVQKTSEPGNISVSVGGTTYRVVGPGENTVDSEHFNLLDIEKNGPVRITLSDEGELIFAVTDHAEKDMSDTPGARVAVEMIVKNLSPMVWHGRIADGTSEKLFYRIEVFHEG